MKRIIIGDEKYESEEWGGWKIVEEMLNHPDKNGIYPTSKCYQELYEFVCEQKHKAARLQLKEVEERLRRKYRCAACDGAKCAHTQCCKALSELKFKDKHGAGKCQSQVS